MKAAWNNLDKNLEIFLCFSVKIYQAITILLNFQDSQKRMKKLNFHPLWHFPPLKILQLDPA